MTAFAALAVDALCAPFGRRAGLRDITLSLAPGERVVLLGPSGSGKTTLLRTIAGLSPASSGTVAIAGRPVTMLPPEQRGAVYLHQKPLLFPHLDVRGNVAFAQRLRRERLEGDAAAVRHVLAHLRLDGFADRRVQSLSGGQQQRVALARALVAAAPVLLLDEPLSALDPALRQEVRDALRTASAEAHQPAQLIVSHDLEDAGLLGDRAGVLLDGALVQIAKPEVLFAAPDSLAVARYLSWPTMLAGVLEADGMVRSALGRVRPGRICLTNDAPGQSVVLAARADALELRADGSVDARLIGRRVRPTRTTCLVQLGDAEAECIDGSGSCVAGEMVRLHVHAERLHAFAAGS